MPRLIWPVVAIPPVHQVVGDRWGVPRDNAVGRHTGVDLWAPVGQRLVAAHEGKVIMARNQDAPDGYGKSVAIDWDDGDRGHHWRILYAHLQSISVSRGDGVSAGQPIGRAGLTGFTTGPHLHFELRMDGQDVDPMLYLERDTEADNDVTRDEAMNFLLAQTDDDDQGVARTKAKLIAHILAEDFAGLRRMLDFLGWGKDA